MTTARPFRISMHAGAFVAALLLVTTSQAFAGFANGDTTKANLLGSVPSVISVDPVGGSAGMGYSLEVPPGRAGMEPSLSLRYNSGSAEPGMLGRGWRLMLPAIQRSTRYGQPAFDWAVDGFTLLWGGGSNDLVKISDSTVGGVGTREYRTLIESFMRIRSNTLPGGFTYWEVWDGSGRVWQFGNPGADGNPTQSGEFQYALNRVQDAHGNYMTFSWLLDNGALYPLEIRYTGHVSGTPSTLPNKVEFAYETRWDVLEERLGVKYNAPSRKMRYRLHRVKTWAGSDVASVYILNYTTVGAGSYNQDLCLGQTCGQTSMVCGNAAHNTVYCNNPCMADTGLCGGCTPSCCPAGGCGSNTLQCSNGTWATCQNPCDQFVGCSPCTPNCSSGSGGGGCLSYPGGVGTETIHPCEGTGIGFTPADPVDDPLPPTRGRNRPGIIGLPGTSVTPSPAAPPPPADYNTSLLANIQRFNRTGSAMLPPTQFQYTTDVAAQKTWGGSTQLPSYFLHKDDHAQGRSTFDYGVQIEDVNRDGRPDMVVGMGYSCGGGTRGTHLKIAGGTGWSSPVAGTFDVPVDFVMADCGHGNQNYDQGVRLVDINGDHLPDIVQSYTWNGGPQVSTVWINGGTNWGPPQPAGPAPQPPGAWVVPVAFAAVESSGEYGITSSDLGVRFADVDGDGFEDLVEGRDGESFDNRDVFRNNRTSGWVSTGWQPPVPFVHHYPGGETDIGVRMLDLNGDGMADLVQSTLWNGIGSKRVWLSKGRPGPDNVLWMEVTANWTIPQYFTVVNGSNDDSDDLGVRFGDVNGDGRVDMVVARRWDNTTVSCNTFGTWGGSTCQAVYLQVGSAWVLDPTWAAGMPSTWFFIEHKQDYEDYDDGARLADVDGDGNVDLLKGLEGWGGDTKEYKVSNDGFSDLLSRIDNGLGAYTTMTYGGSTELNLCAAGVPGCTSVKWDMDMTFPLVTSVVTSDGQTGAGHTYTNGYVYYSGFYHFGRREFRGFRSIRHDLAGTRWHVTRTNVVDESYDVAPLAGTASQVLLKDGVGAGAATLYQLDRTFDRTHSTTTYPTAFHFVTRETEHFYDLRPPSAPYDRIVDVQYITNLSGGSDPFVTSRTVRRFGLTPAEDLDATQEFLNDATAWRVGLLKRSFTADFHADPAAPLTQAWFYYDNLDWGLLGSAGDLTKVEAWSGQTADARGSTGNRTVRTEFDAWGNTTATIDGENHRTDIAFGADKVFPVTVAVDTADDTGVVTHTHTYAYDARFGLVTTMTTPGDGPVSSRYDDFGRLIKTWNAADSEALPTVCVDYTLNSLGIRNTSYRREQQAYGEACGTVGMLGTSDFYDGLGRFIQTERESTSGTQVEVDGTTAYDEEGLVLSTTLPYAASGYLWDRVTPPGTIAKATYDYDQLGRRTKITYPDPAGIPPGTTTVVNKFMGWTVETLDQEGHKSQVDLHPFGWVSERRSYRTDGTTVDGRVTTQHDRLGHLRFVIGPTTAQIEYRYNGFGEQTQTFDPDIGSVPVVYDYNKDGLLKTTTDASGQTTNLTYDALHRLQYEDLVGVGGRRHRYDEPGGRLAPLPRPIGHLTSVQDLVTGVTQQFQYDLIGRPIKSSQTIGAATDTVDLGYDALSRTMWIQYPDTKMIEYYYRPDGRPDRVQGVNIPIVFANNAGYTPWGAMTQVHYGNGMDVSFQYDQAAAWMNHVKACFSCNQTGENKIVDAGIGRDKVGHVTSITDGVTGQNQTFELDHLYRIYTATSAAGYGTLNYRHDPAGNLSTKGATTFDHDVPGFPHHMSRSSDGRTYAYDANGNLEWVNGPSTATRHYVYNSRQELASITDSATGVQIQNLFGPQGQRVRRSVTDASGTRTTTFVGGLYEKTGNLTRKHIYFNGARVAEVDADQGTGQYETYYLVNDQVGSLQAATRGSDGAMVRRMHYQPFGEIFSTEGSGFTEAFGFAGSRSDRELGLGDFGARVYDPSLGRFLSMDPIIQDGLNPMDLNPYGYARGNPVTFADAGGFGILDSILAFFGFGGGDVQSGSSSGPGTGDGQDRSDDPEDGGNQIDLKHGWARVKHYAHRGFSYAWHEIGSGARNVRDEAQGIDLNGQSGSDPNRSGGGTAAGSQPPPFQSHWILRMLVPGQVAWDNAVNAYYQGRPGAAAANVAGMVAEQVLTVTTMRMTQAPTAIIGGATATSTTAATTNGLVTASEAVGGHTISSHVGRTSAQLAERLATDRIRAASTFSTLEEAEAGVASVLRANASQLSQWIANGAAGRLKLVAPFVGGQVLARGAAEPVVGSSVKVILEGTGTGYYFLVTGYPIIP
jgi:RHS repeat-associated protein